MSSHDEHRRHIAQGIQIADDTVVKQSAAQALNDRAQRGHSREDSLDPRQFEQLVEASYEISDEVIALESRTALYVCGRLGLRGGEATHLHESWVDWADGTIDIPEFDPCSKGRDGGVCGYCRRRALDHRESNNLTEQEAIEAICITLDDSVVDDMTEEQLLDAAADLRQEVNITEEEAMATRWEPKTAQSAREVPFDFDVRVELTLEEFFDRFSGWEKSKATLNRRINRLAEIAGLEANVYPHSLRATSASAHASRDISIYALMSIMGWADPGTARTYVQANDEQAAREIRSKHR